MVLDRNPLDRELLTKSLETWYEVCPPVAAVGELCRAVKRCRPSLVVLRLREPNPGEVLEVVRALRVVHEVDPVVIGPMSDLQFSVRCISVGAAAYLDEADCDHTEVRLAIMTVVETGQYLSPALRGRMAEAPLRPKRRFNTHQRQAIRLRQEGKTNREIATVMGITVKAVEKLFARIRRNLGMTGRLDLDWNRVECR